MNISGYWTVVWAIVLFLTGPTKHLYTDTVLNTVKNKYIFQVAAQWCEILPCFLQWPPTTFIWALGHLKKKGKEHQRIFIWSLIMKCEHNCFVLLCTSCNRREQNRNKQKERKNLFFLFFSFFFLTISWVY